jgi:ATP-dependent DNA helicase HFM1/MER3
MIFVVQKYVCQVHLLSDEKRGPVMEAVVSRMKTVQRSLEENTSAGLPAGVRFVAVSATVPNIEDVATWLSREEIPAVAHK